MLTIRPFRGFRPPAAIADQVAALPYDVMNSAEARVMAEGKPRCWLHVTKPEIDLDPSIHLYDDVVYATAVKNLNRFIAEGTIVQDPAPYLYVYRQRMGAHVQTGLLCVISVDDYDADRIKKHEKTRQDKEDDRARHVHETGCNAGPVFLTYRRVPTIDEMVATIAAGAPENDFVSEDGIGHTLWVVKDEAWIAAMVEQFRAVPLAYVADGHHRAKSGSRTRDIRRAQNPNHTGEESYNYFMTVLFPDNQLQILPYNRALKDFNGMTPAVLLETLAEKFTVAPAETPAPTRVHDFGLYVDGRWFRLTAKPAIIHETDPIGRLDVSILQENVLGPLFGIDDPRTSKRIDFVGGIRGAGELKKMVDAGTHVAAFAMFPTTVDQLIAIADAGAIMPPKSTWFEPKLRSGLVVHKF